MLTLDCGIFQDAKEHLAAVADKLGTSLTDIEVSKLQVITEPGFLASSR